MKVIVFAITAQLLTAQLVAGANYYKGEQPASIAGEIVDCYLEVDLLTRGETAKLRVLAADPHDGDLIGLGPVIAHYKNQYAGYYFAAKNDQDKVQELFLSTQNQSVLNSLLLTIRDEKHADNLECKNLQPSSGLDLDLVIEKFEHFDDYTDEDHEHH